MSTAICLRKLLFVVALAILPCSTPASAQPTDPKDPKLKADQFDIYYGEPKNPAHIPIYEHLKKQRVLENLQEFFSPVRLPQRFTLKVEGCDGQTNAYFWDDWIKVCYEYFEFIMKYSPKMEKHGLTPRDAMIGPTVDVFLHELGHLLVEVLDIPFFGREEDTADYIATYILLQFSKDDARRLILGASFLGGAESMEEQGKMPELRSLADVHSLPAVRYFNRWCMAFGYDSELFADAISLGMMPADRAKRCRYEYSSNRFAFQTLVSPYIDPTLRDKVLAKRWFTFESPVTPMMTAPQPVATKSDAAKDEPKAKQ